MKHNSALSLIPVLLVALGCGGGGGGGTPTQPGFQTILFTPTLAASANTISLRHVPGALRDGVGPQQVLSLEVVATQVQNLHSISFEVGFPGNLFTGDRVTLGSHLTHGGVSIEQDGIVGANFFRLSYERDASDGVSGSGVIAVLDMLPIVSNSGSGPVTFFNAEVRNAAGAIKNSVTFIGGTAQLAQ